MWRSRARNQSSKSRSDHAFVRYLSTASASVSTMTPPPPLDEPRYVPASELRGCFNGGPYLTDIIAGRLRPQYLRDRHLEAPAKGNPPCTRRQLIRYWDPDGNPVVEVFQYLREDGTLGASGRPDPKRLWRGGQVFIAKAEEG